MNAAAGSSINADAIGTVLDETPCPEHGADKVVARIAEQQSGQRSNYDKLRAAIEVKASELASEIRFINGRDGVKSTAAYRALQLFESRFHADALGWDHAIDDGIWSLFHDAEPKISQIFALIRDRSDDAELGRLFADAVNAALVERCAQEGADTAEELEAA